MLQLSEMSKKSLAESHKFAKTREAHRDELAQDYVEVILELIEEGGEARLTDIAAKIGVAHPTVSKALRRLHSEGLVLLRPYRALQLTEDGRRLAVECRIRHKIVFEFLISLGLDAETAEIDSEGIEHHVSSKTLKLMERFSAKS
jgi:DtxR family manganese transport transcriptional regulator